MELLVVGCSGSLEGPTSPASGYVVRTAAGSQILVDLGPGTLSGLQRHHSTEINPSDCHVVFSHMHADHCLDFPSLLVWRRYHPQLAATRKHTLLGPSIAQRHLGGAGADHPDHPDDLSDTFSVDVFAAAPETPFDPEQWPYRRIDDLRVYACPAIHPTESYITRFVADSGASLVYTGDTSMTEDLIRIAAGADVLLAEATWGETSEGQPFGMHMSGADAGRAAAEAGVGRLILTHIPPWGDAEGALRGARAYFDGPIDIAAPQQRYHIGVSEPSVQ